MTEAIAMEAISVESVMHEGTTRGKTGARRTNVGETTRDARAVHSAHRMIEVGAARTNVPSESTNVATAEATMPAADTAGVTTAMLRPHRHAEHKRERRDGCRATHSGLL